jgi:hypothetical protein
MPIDPATQQAIVEALVAGATFVGVETAKQVVKDAYGAVKSYFKKRAPGVDLTALEAAPDSVAAQAVVGEALANTTVAQDPQLFVLIDKMLLAVQQNPLENQPTIGVDIGSLRNSIARFGNIGLQKGGTAVHIGEVEGGSVEFGDVGTNSKN